MKCFIFLFTIAVADAGFNFTNTSVINNIPFTPTVDLNDKRSTCPNSDVKPVVSLLNYIVRKYFTNCITLILYDEFFYKSLTFQPVISQLLNSFPRPIIHGQFSSDVTYDQSTIRSLLATHDTRCTDYIILSQTLELVAEMLGRQTLSKVVLVPQASQWALNNFLESTAGNQLVNLLIVADPSLQLDIFTEDENFKEDINVYTQELYADPLGSKVPRLLTSWRCNKLTHPETNLFPPKLVTLNGYQLRVVATNQPPYVYQSSKQDQVGEAVAQWDGLEIRLLKLITEELNITLRFHQPTTARFFSQRVLSVSSITFLFITYSNTGVSWENTAESVLHDLSERKADVAVAGVYMSVERLHRFRFSSIHSHDCAVFMTLASTALPKYRAIMGPFRWEVWMSITLAYIFAIVPLTFSAFHTLHHLIDNPWEIENMFWYVFGTFTNCFTFTGKKSWSSGKMASTRMFIGAYWAFSIIVSAAYTGSIIAFIMLPAFPEVIETTEQLLDNDYRIVTTNKSHLENTLHNSSDTSILKLSHKLKIVESFEEGITNVTDSPFYRQYAFLHSREFLKHIIRTNYTLKKSKKTAFHLSKECFVPMLVAMIFPSGSILVDRIDVLLMRANQGGFIQKLISDVAWDQQKSGTGKLLQISGGGGALKLPSSERQLTLDDTQGMFLLLGIGFALGAMAFVTECLVPVITQHRRPKQDVPSVSLTPASELSSGNFRFEQRDDFLRYFDDPTLGPVEAEVHMAEPPPHRQAQSLTALQQEAILLDQRLSI